MGIRTPWTLDNEEVWRKTHLLAGRFWFWGGLMGIAMTLFLPMQVLGFLLMVLLAILTLTPVVYSFFLHKQLNK